MNTKTLQKWILTALLAAFVTVATVLVQVPIPATGGYVNLGDGVILVAAYLLGGAYGGLAAGVGSALADLVAGYAVYVPGTFVVKALMALTAALVWKALRARRTGLRLLLAGVVGEGVMVTGYFVYEAVFLGYGIGAAASVVSNLLQGAAGIAISTAATAILLNNPAVRRLTENTDNPKSR